MQEDLYVPTQTGSKEPCHYEYATFYLQWVIRNLTIMAHLTIKNVKGWLLNINIKR